MPTETPLIFTISHNYRGEISISNKSIIKIAYETLSFFNKSIQIENVRVRIIDNFYLHIELCLKSIDPKTNLNILVKKIKKAFNKVFLEQINVKVYNIVIMFT